MSVKLRPAVSARQPFPQLRPSTPRPCPLDGDRQCLPLPNKDHQTLAARHPRVDQVSLQHRVVLSAERDHDGRVFRTLALVNRRRVGQHQLIEFAKAVGEISAIEVDGELAFLHVDARHDAEVAVVDLLVIVVLDLHDLISRTEGPAETLDADLTGRIKRVCSSILRERAPRPPLFIGQSTWMSRMGSNPKRFGMRSRTIASSFRTPSSGSVASTKKKSPLSTDARSGIRP